MLCEIIAENNIERRRVLIVTNLMCSEIIKARLQNDLAGLVLTFYEEGLVEYPDFVTWLSKTVSAFNS